MSNIKMPWSGRHSMSEIPRSDGGHARASIVHYHLGKWETICWDHGRAVETHPAKDYEEARRFSRQWAEKGKVDVIGPRDDEDDDADDNDDDEDE